MIFLEKILNKAVTTANLTLDEIIYLLELEDIKEMQMLFDSAYKVKLNNVGNLVNLRGLIEISNLCEKNCYYCGIRRENREIERFNLSKEEIINCAKLALDYNYGSIVLQGGEISSAKHTDFIAEVVKEIKDISKNRLGITLSLGEQTFETYQKWYDAGAHRYLLRIETSSEEIYQKLHPKDHSFQKRLNSLEELRRANYQLGSGIMFGFDGQKISDMAKDLLFLKALDVDMVGMGPYSAHHQTPMGKVHSIIDNQKQLYLGLKMIAVLRLIMPDINIASTTVLQALAKNGRELGLQAGANVIMPNVSDVIFRKAYQLYDNKPGVDENALSSRLALEKSISSINETINYNNWGDSKHFHAKQRK